MEHLPTMYGWFYAQFDIFYIKFMKLEFLDLHV